jgi:hypothetical protein
MDRKHMHLFYIYGGGVNWRIESACLDFKKKSVKYFTLFCMLTFIFIFNNQSKAQQLSFTTNIDTVSPGCQLVIVNTSSGIPPDHHLKYTFENGTVRMTGMTGFDFEYLFFNSDTLQCTVTPFDSLMNTSVFRIIFSLVDSNYIATNDTPYTIELSMFSGLNPPPARSCHDATPTTNQEWCDWNLICNGDFEWNNGAPNALDQLYLAEDWDGLSVEYYHTLGQNIFTPSTSIWGAQVPRSGDGMGGFYGRLGYGYQQEFGSAEAVNVIFKEQLYEQQKYNLEFYLARGTAAPWLSPRYATKIDALLRFSPTQYNSTPIFAYSGLWTAWANGSPTSTMNQQLIFSNGPANLGSVPYWEQHSLDFNPTNSSYAFLTIGLMSLSGIHDLTPGQPIKPGDFGYYYLDDAALRPYPPTAIPHDGYQSMCNGQTTLQVTGAQNVKEYRWYDPNMQLIAGVNGPTLALSAAQLGTYTIEVENYHHCVNTYTCELLPSPTYSALTFDNWLPEPVVDGPPELCPVPASQTYVIENPQPTVIYTWTTVPAGITITPLTQTRDQVVIDWTTAPTAVSYTIEVKAVYPNCTYTSAKYYVFECCFSESDPLSFMNFVLTPASVQTLSNNSNLHGIITVTDQVTISGLSLHMGPGAKIKVTDNSSLTLDQTILDYSCDMMWNGIFVQNPVQEVSVVNGSQINNAVNGILSRNGGVLTVEASFMNDCDIGIKVMDYHRTHFIDPAPQPISCSITGTQITGADLTIPPFFPSGKLSTAGIYLKNTESITIGSVSASSNLIQESRYGIFGINILAEIENNTITQIMPNIVLPVKFGFGAIHTLFYPRKGVVADLYKGTVTAHDNIISYSNVGILSHKNKVNLYNNEFTNMSGDYCIKVIDCNNPSTINENSFKQGVKLGIYTARAAGAYSPGFEIVDNNMVAAQNTLRQGIRLLNIKGQYSSPSAQPRINENKITFYHMPAPTLIHFGIYADNCHNTHFACNLINRYANYSDWDKMWGIRLSQTMGAQVYDNDIQKMGAAIYTSGDLYNTLFYCNLFNMDYYGYYFGPKTGLTNQGFAPGTSSSYPNGWNPKDEWQLVGSNYLSGSLRLETNTNATNIISPPIKWYHYPVLQFDPEVHASPNFPTNSGKIISNPQPNAANACASACMPLYTLAMLDTLELTDEERDALFYGILQAREYDELMEEYRIYDEEYLFTQLSDDTTLLWLGGENDQEYREFYDSVKASNANRFLDIEKLIDSQVYDQAMEELQVLAPLNTIETNLKTAYRIYLTSWALGRFDLTQEEEDTLTEIALQLPYAGGRGVYTARIMLGIEPFDNNLTYRLAPEPMGWKKIVAYPNPASDIITFEFDKVPPNENANIEIIAITGRILKTIAIQQLITEIPVETGNLPNGIYLVRIRYSSGEQASSKFVIKQ